MNAIKKAEAPREGNISPRTSNADNIKPRSRKGAIYLMCKNCIYSPGEGSWRKQVANCASKACALLNGGAA